MIEYEYSFNVTDIEPFIQFCESNGYQKEDAVKQTRILYKNQNGILARITTSEVNNQIKKYLNFKESNESNVVLKKSKETAMMEVTEKNKEFIDSMLEILNFKKSKELKRIRYVYKKNNVIFEIDNYTQPLMKVVAIEGNKIEVDNIYKEIDSLYTKYKLN